MGIPKTRNLVVGLKLICEYNRLIFFDDAFRDHRKQSVSLNIGNDLNYSIPVPFHKSHNNRFAGGTTTTLAMRLAADVSLVNLDLTAKRVNIFGHEFANLTKDTPCGFVSDTQFPLKLLGRDSGFGRGHKKHGMEPRAERGIRFMEDGSRSRGNTHSAELARVEFHVGSLVMLRNLATLRAKDTFRPASLKENFKASIIGWEHLVEIFDSVGSHVVSPISPYTYTIAQELRNVKG
jgi:hypothetical protein